MDELERLAVSQAKQSVRLEVSLTSREFYLSLGYRITEACAIDVGDGEKLDYWNAIKDLPETADRSASHELNSGADGCP
jgi:hypothetical protein